MKRQAAAQVRPITAQDLLGSSGIDAVLHHEGAVRRFSTGARSLGDYADDVASTARINAKALQEKVDGLGRRQAEAGERMREELGGVQPQDVANYCADLWQRWAIFMDILRRRGNTFVQHTAEGCPPVLVYDFDVVIDGMTLERPVNYSLVAIHPPKGVKVRQDGRPYIIVDPRAGHGSGIGGFKNESEVGVALHAGHPVYFCIFATQPTPTQTLADVTRAEADFVREVRRRHPRSPKPVIIGNCQGGWAAMLLAASNPDLAGPVVVNGAPLSYWAGTRGKNPMRYAGGMLGGVTPALLMADLRQRPLRRRQPGAQLREPQPRQQPVGEVLRRVRRRRGPGRALPRLRALVVGLLLHERGRDPLDRREPVRGQPAGPRRRPARPAPAHRPAQHPRAHHRVRLARRQHHAAAAGAQLDLRPLRQRPGDQGAGAAHRLHHPRQGRAPGHLRLLVDRPEGAPGDRLDAEGHRGDGAGALRDEDRGRRGRWAREALRDLVPRAHDRRHPRARRRARRRAAVRRGVPALPHRRGEPTS